MSIILFIPVIIHCNNRKRIIDRKTTAKIKEIQLRSPGIYSKLLNIIRLRMVHFPSDRY